MTALASRLVQASTIKIFIIHDSSLETRTLSGFEAPWMSGLPAGGGSHSADKTIVDWEPSSVWLVQASIINNQWMYGRSITFPHGVFIMLLPRALLSMCSGKKYLYMPWWTASQFIQVPQIFNLMGTLPRTVDEEEQKYIKGSKFRRKRLGKVFAWTYLC